MNDPKRPVLLEDLLRLKRAERPVAEFWPEFDRQLRAKQLAALVEKRPWFHTMRDSFLRVGRYHVAFGTAAVVAFVFISNRDRILPAAGGAALPQPVSGVTAIASTVKVDAGSTAMINESITEADSSGRTAPVSSSDNAHAVAATSTGARLSRTLAAAPRELVSETLSRVDALTPGSFDAEPTSPSARFIAANFAAAQASETSGVAFLGSSGGFESRALPARNVASIEPLQQIAPPGEPRRATRYLAAMISATTEDQHGRTTERAANRISQDELYDQVRRFGTRQGGFNMKF